MAPGVGDIGRVSLGLNHVLLTGHTLEGFSKIGVRAVLVGDVKKADPAVERMPHNLGETLNAQPGLVAGLT